MGVARAVLSDVGVGVVATGVPIGMTPGTDGGVYEVDAGDSREAFRAALKRDDSTADAA